MAVAGAVLDHPSLAFALAMTIGVFAQGLARHLYLPGVFVLLVAGVLLGPEVAGVIRPPALGPALSAVVGFAVAVILFEGGLNLELRVLPWQAKPIRRLGATLARVRPDTRIACIGLTANEEVNLRFARKVLAEFRGPQAYVAIEADAAGVTEASAAAEGARVLFGGARHWQDWLASWRHGRVEVAWYVRGAGDGAGTLAAPRDVVLPIVLRRGDELAPIDASTRTQAGDCVEFAVAFERRQQGLEWLRAAGWVRAESDD